MMDFIVTALTCVIGALALLGGYFWWWSNWLSRQKLDAMQGAFRFLEQDFGMRCVRRWDQGMGAEVRFADEEVAVSIWNDRGYYSATLALLADARYQFDLAELRPVGAEQIEGRSVAALGESVRREFVQVRAALRSERADAIVRDRSRSVSAHPAE